MANKRNNKRCKVPKRKRDPSNRKAPRLAEDPAGFDSRRMAWHLGEMDFDGPFGWSQHDIKSFSDLCRDKFLHFERMKWSEIKRNGQSHEMDPADICKDARQRLEDIGQADVAVLFSLRITGACRIWGIRDRAVFKLLWWDPDHQVYPVQKRHT